MNNKFWFYLESYIYVCIKDKVMLLYDTHNGRHLHFKSTKALQIVNKIYENENLGSIEIDTSDMSNLETHNFIDTIVINGMGKLQSQQEYPVKPVVLLPILSLNFDVDKFKDITNAELCLARDISNYLLDVNIILNNSCNQHCSQCQNYHKQFFCCFKDSSTEKMNQQSLIKILRQINYYPVRTINITGGNIYQYQHLELFDITNVNTKKEFNFYVHYLNYQENHYVDNHNIHIIVNFPLNISRLRDVKSITKGKNVKYHLIVEDEEQYNMFESTMSEFDIEDFEVHPCYNGNNSFFFEENVFMSKEDILDNNTSMREIFRNQKMNANFFGSLYFFPNGEIKANPNEETIGNLNDDGIVDVINTEMVKNTAWRKIRFCEPCSNCLYQYLCPPLSNYEKVMKRNNLCKVKF